MMSTVGCDNTNTNKDTFPNGVQRDNYNNKDPASLNFDTAEVDDSGWEKHLQGLKGSGYLGKRKSSGKIHFNWTIVSADYEYPSVNGGLRMSGDGWGNDLASILNQLPVNVDVELTNWAYHLEAGVWMVMVTKEIQALLKLGEDIKLVPLEMVIEDLLNYGINEITISRNAHPHWLTYRVKDGYAYVKGLSDLWGDTQEKKRKLCYFDPSSREFMYGATLEVVDTFCGLPVTKIEKNAFARSEIMSIILNKNLTTIGSQAFRGCNLLEFVCLTSSVTHIEENAFANCDSSPIVCYNGTETKWANLSKTVKAGNFNLFNTIVYGIDDKNFTNLYYTGTKLLRRTAAEHVIKHDSILAMETYRYMDYAKMKELTSGLFNEISDDHFVYTSYQDSAIIVELKPISGSSIKKAVIPERISGKTVREIGRWSFRDRKVDKLVIPSSIIRICAGAFDNCSTTNMSTDREVYFNTLEDWLNMDMYDYETCSPFIVTNINMGRGYLYVDNKLITQLVIPDGVEYLRPYCLAEITVESVVIPTSVKKIGATGLLNFDTAYYKGSDQQWQSIEIDDKDGFLEDCIEFDYKG